MKNPRSRKYRMNLKVTGKTPTPAVSYEIGLETASRSITFAVPRFAKEGVKTSL
jgi:hypothetical protein